MVSTSARHKAEQAAKVYLEMRGYELIEQNYRRSRCEIDIVAKKNNIVFFIEVKYHHSDTQASGAEYITPTKLRQMQFAAETWLDEYKWRNTYQLSTIEIASSDFVVLSFVESIL